MPKEATLCIQQRPVSTTFPLVLFLFLSLLLICGSTALAATWYVKPSAEIPVRSGQGAEFKILAVVPDGMEVALLEEADPWARIRTPAGTEGWILKRYLSNEPSLVNTLAALRTERDRLEGENNELATKFNELSQNHAESVEHLDVCRAERDEARNSYESLRQDAAEIIATKQDLAQASSALETARTQLAAKEKENDGLRRKSSLMWFLAGAFVLLCGWFLGSLSAKQRKRKTTLY